MKLFLRKYWNLFLLLVLLLALLFFIHSSHTAPQTVVGGKPFRIAVSEPKIVIENQQIVKEDGTVAPTGGVEHRLAVSVTIDNQTNQEFKKVWFSLQLNPEVQPYLAADITEFSSEKMDVTTSAKALAPSQPGELHICGFEHEWNMLLTTADNLKTYHGLSPDGIEDALKSLTIQLHWDTGEQRETFPLQIVYEQ